MPSQIICSSGATKSKIQQLLALGWPPPPPHRIRSRSTCSGNHPWNYHHQHHPCSCCHPPILGGYLAKHWHNLRQRPSEVIDTLPHELFQKFIWYAKTNCQPEISDEADYIIGQFYINMRKELVHGPNSMPCTPRQLQTLFRMSIARARIEMAEEVTRKHAEDVLELVRFSQADILKKNVAKKSVALQVKTLQQFF
jgi:DNA replicative helicase MCM subunit Mcm2 (Cdc46/Mcm family)